MKTLVYTFQTPISKHIHTLEISDKLYRFIAENKEVFTEMALQECKKEFLKHLDRQANEVLNGIGNGETVGILSLSVNNCEMQLTGGKP